MKARLSGVPETLLWTLYLRSREAERPDSVLHDPWAVELVQRLDYPFAERFGTALGPQPQWQALRSRTFDAAVRRFQADCPGGTVVALGDGLDTACLRVDDGRVRWLSVELPETAALRRALLPDDDRRRTLGCSVLDDAWLEAVDPSRGVLLLAQGVLMYLRPGDVHALFDRCAARFPAAALVFDTAPRWFALLARRGLLRLPSGWTAPPMPWGFDALERRRLAARPSVARLRELPLPRGRGPALGLAYPALERVPLLRDVTMAVLEARLAA